MCDHVEKYMGSSKHNEKSYVAFCWVTNEVYEYLLNHPLETIDIYENKKYRVYLLLVSSFVKQLTKYSDRDFEMDWRLHAFIPAIQTAYKQSKIATMKNSK